MIQARAGKRKACSSLTKLPVRQNTFSQRVRHFSCSADWQLLNLGFARLKVNLLVSGFIVGEQGQERGRDAVLSDTSFKGINHAANLSAVVGC